MKPHRSHPAFAAMTAMLSLVFVFSALTACTDTMETSRRTTTAGETEEVKPEASGITAETTENITEAPVETTDGDPVTTDSTRSTTEYINKGNWIIWARYDDGVRVLQVGNSGANGRETEMDYIDFRVYESAADAEKKYNSLYEKSKKIDGGKFWEEGDCWFISEQPDVYDYSPVWICYLDGNVIIYTELGSTKSWEAWISGNDPDGTAFNGNYNRALLKDYILNNEPEILAFVKDLTADCL